MTDGVQQSSASSDLYRRLVADAERADQARIAQTPHIAFDCSHTIPDADGWAKLKRKFRIEMRVAEKAGGNRFP